MNGKKPIENQGMMFNIQSQVDRNNFIIALANNGYSVRVRKDRLLLRDTYWIIVDDRLEEIRKDKK